MHLQYGNHETFEFSRQVSFDIVLDAFVIKMLVGVANALISELVLGHRISISLFSLVPIPATAA